MKPAQFDYYEPTTVTEALNLLAQFAETAKPLAGGQSLVPMMNMRLARPAQIIDLNRLDELDYLKVENGELRVGAMTRQRTLERSTVARDGWPLLQEAVRHIGHVQIRNRGTIGGSLAHAFPSAELPLAMTSLNASFVLRSAQGERVIPAQDFFIDIMTTALKSDELVIEAQVPRLAAGTGYSFQEVSRRHGDFALAGVAALIALDANGAISHARLTFTGSTPIRATRAEEIVLGQKPSEELFRDAARRATENLEQDSDIHASAEYRRQVCEVLARRALTEAAARSAQRVEAESR